MEQSNMSSKLQKKRQRKDKIYGYKDFDHLNSGKSSILEPIENLQPYKQFSKLIGQKSIKGVTAFLKEMRGRNEPMTCSKDYNFKQRWEFEPNRNDEEKLIYKEISNVTIILSTAMMIIKILLIWIISIFRVFGCVDNCWIFICGITFQLIEIVINLPFVLILSKKQIGKQPKIKIEFHKQDLKMFLKNIYSLCYHFLGVININTIENTNDLFLLPFDWLIVFFIYARTKKVYHELRILAVRSRYKHWMNLFDLMTNLFIMAHLFAILLFLLHFCISQRQLVSQHQPSS